MVWGGANQVSILRGLLCVHRQGLDGDEFEVKGFVSSAAAAVAKDVFATATGDEVVDGGCRGDGRLEHDAGAQGVLEGKEESEDCAHESFAGLRPPGKPGLGLIQDGIRGELVKPNTENAEERGGEGALPSQFAPLRNLPAGSDMDHRQQGSS